MTTTITPQKRLPAPPEQRRSRTSLRPVIARLHFYAGIIAAPLIFVAALTGLGYAAAPQLEKVVYHDLLFNSTSGAELPASQLYTTAQEAAADRPLKAMILPKGEHDNARFQFHDPAYSDGTNFTVYVDPHTGDVAGTSTSYGGSNALPLRRWLSLGHANLWLGDAGRYYSELAAAWMGFLAVGGGYLWFTAQPKRLRGARARVRSMFVFPSRPGSGGGGSGRARGLRWHSAFGTWALAGMLFLTVTGLTWSQVAGENISQVRQALSWSTPRPDTALADGAALQEVSAGTIDTAARLARENLQLPVTVAAPRREGASWTAVETRVPYRVEYNTISFDAVSGTVTGSLRFADYPLAAKLTAWLIELHMGMLFGLPNQLALAALALAIIAVVVKGYQLWWRRGPGPAPAARGWKAALSTPAGAVFMVVVLGYSILAPLFGASLVAIVAGDWVLSRALRRRRPAAPAPAGAGSEQ